MAAGEPVGDVRQDLVLDVRADPIADRELVGAEQRRETEEVLGGGGHRRCGRGAHPAKPYNI
jgi:hypothetical protein